MIIIPTMESIKSSTEMPAVRMPAVRMQDGARPARRRGRTAAVVAGIGVAVAGVAGCSPAAGETPSSPAAGRTPSGTTSVVATTTMLGDVAGQVAECGGLTVTTLMPVGADPHDFAPSSADVATIVGADLVVANALGLEESMATALDSARADGATILELAPLLDPIPMADTHDHEGEGEAEGEADDEADDDGHHHGSTDPHFWLDAARMAHAARLIGDELARITGDDALTTCGEKVSTELDALDAEVRETLATVPAEHRVLITDHAAFGYFAQAYDFEIPGVVVPGGSTLGAPSSAELAALVGVLQESGVRAIFANTARATDLVDALAAEVGHVDVVELYVGSVGPAGSGADTYAGMMRTDATLIAQALGE